MKKSEECEESASQSNKEEHEAERGAELHRPMDVELMAEFDKAAGDAKEKQTAEMQEREPRKSASSAAELPAATMPASWAYFD